MDLRSRGINPIALEAAQGKDPTRRAIVETMRDEYLATIRRVLPFDTMTALVAAENHGPGISSPHGQEAVTPADGVAA